MKSLIVLITSIVVALPVVCSATEIHNLKCKDGWVMTGSTKLELVTRCGSPSYEEVTSGDDAPKREQLLYSINGKNFTIFMRDGKVIKIDFMK